MVYYISATAFSGAKAEHVVMDKELALTYFNAYNKAEDIKGVDLCSNLTGEVFLSARRGKIEYVG